MNEPIEAEVVEEHRGSALAVSAHRAQVVAWTPQIEGSVDDAIQKSRDIDRFIDEMLHPGVHFGNVPGSEKPSLWKPGAQKLCSRMGLRPTYRDDVPPIRDWGAVGDDGRILREGEITYVRTCSLWRYTGPNEHDRILIAEGSGSCSSRETKYRWRESKRKCPACGKESIIKGKKEYGGGWLCFKKQGGCGAKYDDNDTEIASQVVGRIPNPDLADIDNTILKMANKRAYIDATLNATGCADRFTQDLEDLTGEPEIDVPPAPSGGSSTPPEVTPTAQRPQPAAQNPVKEKLKALLRDERLTPSEREACIFEVTGSTEASSITSPEIAQQVIDKLQKTLATNGGEIPW